MASAGAHSEKIRLRLAFLFDSAGEEMTNTSWWKRLVLIAAATAFLLAAGSALVARTKRFKSGFENLGSRDDGMVQKWKMAWKGDLLELFDGKVTLRLHYNGETQCK
jgi:hypothetical protein